MINKHLLFRRFPVMPETVMDRIADLYTSLASLSKSKIAEKVSNETGFYVSKKVACEFIDFAREHCDLKPCSADSKFNLNSKMRFFKNGKVVKEVIHAC